MCATGERGETNTLFRLQGRLLAPEDDEAS